MPPPPRTGKARWAVDPKTVVMRSEADGGYTLRASLTDNGIRVATLQLLISADRAVQLSMVEEIAGAFRGGENFTAWMTAAI